MRLYKYLGAEGVIKTLGGSSLLAKRPSLFNDPFELEVVAPYLTLEQIHATLSTDVRAQWAYIRDGVTGSVSAFKRRYREKMRPIAARLFRAQKVGISPYKSGIFRAAVEKDWAMTCASTVEDSLLMWAHYADDHKGAVVEFETDQIPRSRYVEILEVKYQQRRVEIDITPFNKKGVTNDMEALRTKSEHWGYEKEWRILSVLKDNSRVTGITYLELPPEAIKRVIVGVRASRDTLSKLAAILDEPRYTSVQRQQMALHDYDFSLLPKSWTSGH